MGNYAKIGRRDPRLVEVVVPEDRRQREKRPCAADPGTAVDHERWVGRVRNARMRRVKVACVDKFHEAEVATDVGWHTVIWPTLCLHLSKMII